MKIAKYVFLTLGVLGLVGTYFLYQKTTKFIADAITTKGTVVELLRIKSDDSYTYKPLINFKTKTGELVEFSSSSSSNPPSYSKGEVVEVLYLENKPERARINGTASLWLGSIILGVLSSVFFLIGIFSFLFKINKEKRIQSLKDNGMKITTEIQNVDINNSYKVNGRSPFVIYSQWKNPTTSEIHIFKSENIWFDPTDYVKNDEITVLIERNNPKKYHMDISFLPKLSK